MVGVGTGLGVRVGEDVVGWGATVKKPVPALKVTMEDAWVPAVRI